MELSKKNTLSKEERLHSKRQIDQLFASGKSFIAYPLRIVYSEQETTEISILVSVSKKRFKRAVKRNRVKRLIKEAFRINKQVYKDVYENQERGLNIAFLYLKNELPDFKEIEKAILKTADILKEKKKENTPHE